MKNVLFLVICIFLSSCSTPSKWKLESSSIEPISFKGGVIELKPKGSNPGYSQEKDILSLNIKVANKTNEIIEIDRFDIYAQTLDGAAINPMNDQEIKAYTDKVGAFSTVLVSGAFADPSHAQNSLNIEAQSKMLKSTSVPPNSFVEGELWFAIPKKDTDRLVIRFYKTLESNEKVVIERSSINEKKKNKKYGY